MTKLLYLKEVGDLMRKSEAQMRWMHFNSMGPTFVKIGGRLMAREEDVEAWIDAQFAKESA